MKRTHTPPSPSPVAQRLAWARKLYAEVLHETGSDREAEESWRMNLPPLDSRENIHAYIACIAVGCADRIIAADEGRLLLYAAQMALATIGGARG